MKIESIAPGPATPSQESPQQSAREKAMARFVEQMPVKDANSVAPEEMGAIRAPDVGQPDKSVSPKADTEVPEVTPKADEGDKEPPLSAQYANLARKEKAIRAAAQKLKADQAAFEAQRQSLVPPKAVEPAFDPSKYIQKDRLSQDPLSVLTEAGLTYDQLTEMILNQPKSDPAVNSALETIRAEMKALKDAQDESKKFYAEQQQNQYKQAVAQIKSEAKQLVTSDPYFETIAKTGSVNDVVELIERTFKEEGVLMSVEDAAKEVEDYLADQIYGYANKIEKLKKRFQPQGTNAASPEKQPEAPKQPQQMKTLTNSVGTTRQLSAKERAILAFKGEIKS